MKGLNIMGIIIAVATFAVAGYYFELINSARWRPYWDDSYYGPSAADITAEAGLVFLVISGFMVYQLITNLVKIKTITTKVLGIIGISLIGLAFLWNLIMLADPRGISFDEGGQIWLLASMIMLAFSIVFLVQCNYSSKKGHNKTNNDIIDDEII